MHERDIAVDTDHTDICQLLNFDGSPHPEVIERLRSMVDNTSSIVHERLQSCRELHPSKVTASKLT